MTANSSRAQADRPIDSVDRSMPSLPSAGITRNGVHPQIRLRVLVLSLNVGRCGQGRRRAATSSLAPAHMGLLDCGPRGGEGVAENSVPGIRPGPTLHDKHTIGRWVPGPQHEPRGGPESQSAHSSRDRPRRGRVCAGFWTPAAPRLSTRAAGRRPKSARARSRGELGSGWAASAMGISG